MRVGSLFSGVGGMDAGLARAGLEHSFLCEIDEWRRGVLAARFPGVPIYDDVGHVSGGNGLRDGREPTAATESGKRPAPSVGLLAGGFPCQDLSVAGQRRGLEAGERSSLFFEFARVADELVRPGGWVLIENVPGLLSSQDGRDFALVLATLAELGFHDLAWRVLDSRYFGVPQRRRRVFILARRCAGGRGAFEVLLEPEGGGGDSAAGEQEGPGVAYASALGTTRGGGHGLNAEKAAGGQLIAALTTRAGNTQDDQQSQQLVVADTLTSGSHPGSNMPGRRREDDANIVVASESGSGWWQEGEARLRSQGGGTPQNVAYVNALKASAGRQNGDPSGDHTRAVLAGAGVRRLTPVECERLQGLPDGWTAPDGMSAPDSRRYAALGDAVTANVAEWIGRRLMDWNAALRGEASLSSRERDRSAT